MTMVLPVIFFLTACSGSQPGAAPDKPARAEPIGHETNLLRITLSAQAIQRLGIKTAPASDSKNTNNIMLHGEVIVPPAGGGVPVTSASDLATLASNQARADGDVMRTARNSISHSRTQRAPKRSCARKQAVSGCVTKH